MTLAEASRESVALARKLVSSIPELLRALVIMVPGDGEPRGAARNMVRIGKNVRRVRGRRAKRYSRRAGRPRGGGRTGESR
ncbi:hypothetical protein D1872_321220 [compost metagenome]